MELGTTDEDGEELDCEQAGDDRRDAGHDIDEEGDRAAERVGRLRVLDEVDRPEDAERHRDARRQNGYRQRAHNQRKDAEFGRLGRVVP